MMGDTDVRLAFDAGWSVWAGLAILLLALVAGAAAYPRAVRALTGGRARIGLLLRLLALLCLVCLLLRPELRLARNTALTYRCLVLLDRSASMSVRDVRDGPTRLRQAVLALLDGERAVSRAESMALTIRPFAQHPGFPVSGEDLLDLTPARTHTWIAQSLRETSKEEPPARIVLVTDGNDTAGVDPLPVAEGLGIPVDTVAVGRPIEKDDAFVDVAIAGLDHRDRAPVGSVTQIVAYIDADGVAGETAKIVLRRDDKTLATNEAVLDDAAGPQAVTLNFHPETTGLVDLTVAVEPLPGESVIENNTASFPLWVHERLPRVMYLEGEIRPDYKFLRRALATDPGLEFMSFIHTGDGRFLRQGSISGLELEGLPQARSDLASLNVLILGDLARAELGDKTAALLRAAVADGMGLLVLPGSHTTGARSRLAESPLGEALPLAPAPERDAPTGPIRITVPQIARADVLGEALAPFFPPLPEAEDKAPTLAGADPAGELRPGAVAVLVGKVGDGPPVPVLVTRRFGRGKVAVFLGHDAWRWVGLGGGRTVPYADVWGRIVRWLGRDADDILPDETGLVLTANRLVVRPDEPIVFSARIKTPPGQEAPAVRARVVPDAEAGTDPFSLPFASLPSLPGAYEARFEHDKPGAYTLSAEATVGDTVLAQAELTFRIRGGPGEFDRLAPNERLLRWIALETRGQFVALPDLPGHLERLAERQEAHRERLRVPLWNKPLLFALFVLLLSGEWLLRKRWGLP